MFIQAAKSPDDQHGIKIAAGPGEDISFTLRRDGEVVISFVTTKLGAKSISDRLQGTEHSLHFIQGQLRGCLSDIALLYDGDCTDDPKIHDQWIKRECVIVFSSYINDDTRRVDLVAEEVIATIQELIE